MPLSAIDRLRLFLRPPGRGIYTSSTGGSYAAVLLKQLYGTEVAKDIQSAWEDSLQRIRRIEGIILGVPSDTGAGILRGSNFGPIGVREAFLSRFGGYPKSVVDIGDVIVVPQLLHDEMLNESQLQKTRMELYPGVTEPLPVSPLSVAKGVLESIYELNPQAKIYLIGGDHSVTWPAMEYCHNRAGKEFGVVHFDAHTDLMEQRLGIKYCFSTWAAHATKLMNPGHLVQVGLRTSTKTKEYWMEKFPVFQVWAREVPGHETEVVSGIIQHLLKRGVKELYISNDIDGTDSGFAPSTGTPEKNGLSPQFIEMLISALRQKFKLLGGDVVEVAPPLSGGMEFATEKTCLLAAQYLKALL